jgi:hypothetical protein
MRGASLHFRRCCRYYRRSVYSRFSACGARNDEKAESGAAMRISNRGCSPLRINGRDPAATAAKEDRQKNSYYDGLRFAEAKNREQPLPPTAVVGFNSEAGAAKDRSPIANIDPDRALVSFKEMPITAVEANHDALKVACGEIGGLAVERAAVINHFECRQNPALLGIIEFDGSIWQPCRNDP